ncbi:MAG: hypothetical protein Q9225_001946 [Loekoesia sp. 1 TL-2023]
MNSARVPSDGDTTHKSPADSSTPSAPKSETAVERAFESEPEADAGASAGSSAAETMNSYVEEVAKELGRRNGVDGENVTARQMEEHHMTAERLDELAFRKGRGSE